MRERTVVIAGPRSFRYYVAEVERRWNGKKEVVVARSWKNADKERVFKAVERLETHLESMASRVFHVTRKRRAFVVEAPVEVVKEEMRRVWEEAANEFYL